MAYPVLLVQKGREKGMTDDTKLIERLRSCSRQGTRYGIAVVTIADAAAAIEELRKVNRELIEMYEDAVRKLPNRGEWISVNPMVDSVQCSVCGGELFSAELETPYCPYCGAKMEVPKEDA